MSHLHERKEKICLNCRAELHGRYCHRCGQQNIEPKESVWGLITHYFNDITHFDGSFFRTAKDLIFKPGFLSKEYIIGKRASYLHPIRMYIFTSAFFFIVFFSMFNAGSFNTLGSASGIQKSTNGGIDQVQALALEDAKTTKDSLEIKEAFGSSNNAPVTATDSSGKAIKSSFSMNELRYLTKAAYDSAQMRLPAKQRDGWYEKNKTYKQIEIREKFRKSPDTFLKDWINILIHMFPQLLFVSLPIFALILKFLYIRHRQYYYADHAIFGIHLYIFSFVAMLIYFMIAKLKDYLHWSWLDFVLGGIILYILLYIYLALRNFYRQGYLKTLVKYALLNIMSFIVILLLFVVFFMLSVFKI